MRPADRRGAAAATDRDGAARALTAGAALVRRASQRDGRELPFMVALNMLRELDTLLSHLVEAAAGGATRPAGAADPAGAGREGAMLDDLADLRARLERFSRPASSAGDRAPATGDLRPVLGDAATLYARLALRGT